MEALGIELRSSGLVTSTFASWAILLAQVLNILKKLSYCYPKQPHNLYHHQKCTMLLSFWYCFWVRVIYGSGSLQTWYVAEAGLELQILLLLPSGAVIPRVCHHSHLSITSSSPLPVLLLAPHASVCPYHHFWIPSASSLLRMVGFFPITCPSNHEFSCTVEFRWAHRWASFKEWGREPVRTCICGSVVTVQPPVSTNVLILDPTSHVRARPSFKARHLCSPQCAKDFVSLRGHRSDISQYQSKLSYHHILWGDLPLNYTCS